MKQRIIFLLLFVLTAVMVQAQDWSNYRLWELYPGYVVKNDGEIVEGYIEAQKRGCIGSYITSNQTSVNFFTDPRDTRTKIVYTPDYIKAYVIGDRYYKSMHYSGGLMSKPMRFLLQISDGYISKYVWYEPNETNTGFEDKIVYQKGDEMPIEMTSLMLNFTDKVSKLVAEDVELAQKVLNKEKGYGRLNIDKIIAEYNSWYRNNMR